MAHLQVFLQEHPELQLVSSLTDEEQAVLLWAHEKKYIHLTTAPSGPLCFSEHDIECAFMWKEKIGDE